ncbi:MAG: DNA polymerase III subunits gamma and tau (EC [Candidatus Burkholderia crenata]|nr:MAG: DNA polymerase III subunits gamma and tau (EC [Candidatus Burkholderia crenata]
MTYQVLARKWRPKSFASLVGQEHVVLALTHALDGGRLHHAYLFTGTRGVGKTTLSRIFAKALNCETGVTSTPCGVCRACKEIDEGRFVDYVEMDAASNRGVDEMATLLERAVYAPVDARFKVYMIDEVHMLTNHAFNAMLKTLEEPPAHVKFILATTDPQKIPVTVLSRCLQFNLKQMPAGQIVGHLEHVLGEEQIPFEPQALRLLSRAADGSMRDALSLTDQAIAYSANQVTEEAVRGMLGALDQSYLIRLLDTLAAGDGQGVLGIADEMALRSLSFSMALQDLAGLLHRIAWAQFAPASVLDEWPEATDIRRFADLLSAEHVQLFYQIATIGRGELGLAPDEYAGFTMTLLRMLAFEPAGGPGGGGGGGARVRPAMMGAPTTGTRESAPSGVAADGSGGSGIAKPVANCVADVASAQAAAPGSDRAKAPLSQGVVSERSAAANGSDSVSVSASHERPAASGADSAVQSVAVEPEPASKAPMMAEPDQTAAVIDTPAVSLARDNAPNDTAKGKVETLTGKPEGVEAGAADAQSAPTAISAGPGPPEVIAPSADPSDPPPSVTTPSSGDRSGASPDEVSAAPESEPDSNPASLAAAVQELVDRAAAGRAENQTTPSAEKMVSPRGAGVASAALDVLRSTGMRVSSDRVARAPEPVRKPVAPKVAPTVQVPVPRRPAASPDRSAASAAGDSRFNGAQQDANGNDANAGAQRGAGAGKSSRGATPPWEEMPLDDYQSVSSDDGYFMPPAVPLDAIGVSGDWPTLAVDLPPKGIAYQLAFNSELTACDDTSITLAVPVPQYAESAQVAKLKTALTDKLGRPIDVNVSVGPARRTAAAVDAAARAQRQQKAEQEITQNPFVQSLIRDFGASIVQGSIKPIASGNAQGGGQNDAASTN